MASPLGNVTLRSTSTAVDTNFRVVPLAIHSLPSLVVARFAPAKAYGMLLKVLSRNTRKSADSFMPPVQALPAVSMTRTSSASRSIPGNALGSGDGGCRRT